MTRLASSFDRLAALVVGAVLMAIGAALVLWDTSVLPGIPRTVHVAGPRAATETGWWVWALAAVGIVLVVVSVRWLFAHTPAAKVKRMTLRSNDSGSIGVDLGEVADAAAVALSRSLDAESASGKAVIDRGTRTVDLTVTTAATPRPERLVPAIDEVCAQVASMLADPTIATRTTIRVNRGTRNRRVR